ncbi:MAG: hypothetical protein ACRDCW_10090, partial [Sarcina sp.]
DVDRNKSLEVHPNDKEKRVNLVFNKDGEVITGEQLAVTARVRVNNMDAFTDAELEGMGMDVANPDNLKVELIVEFGEENTEPKTHIFNATTNDPALGGVNDRIWYMKPVTPYVARVGLFNGRLTLPDNTLSKESEQDITKVNAVASQILEEAPEFALAEENHFGLGMLIKPQPGVKSITPIKRMSENDSKQETIAEGIKTYRLDEANNKFVLHTERSFDPTSIYLMTIDYYIDGISPGEVPEQFFEVGFEVKTIETITGSEPVEKKEFWGIKVNTVDKPEHF